MANLHHLRYEIHFLSLAKTRAVAMGEAEALGLVSLELIQNWKPK